MQLLLQIMIRLNPVQTPLSRFVTHWIKQVHHQAIKLWNSNGFAQNEIHLIDHLDLYVKYLCAESNEHFSIQQVASDL